MSIDKYKQQIRWVNEELEGLKSELNNGDIEDAKLTIESLENEINELISRADNIVCSIENLCYS